MRRMWICLAALCSFFPAAFGAGIPTVDVADIAQNTLSAQEEVAQTLKQIEEYKTQIEQYTKQLEQLKEQLRNGMGLEDLAGQFQDLFSSFQDMQDYASLDPNSVMNQLLSGSRGGGGGASSLGTIDDLPPGGGVGKSNTKVPPAPDGTDTSEAVGKYGSPDEYSKMPQNMIRYYVKEGANEQITAYTDWMNNIVSRQKAIDENFDKDMEATKTYFESASDRTMGGTNKLLAQIGVILVKLVQMEYTQMQATVKREMAEVVAALNANSRVMDQDQQMLRIRQDNPDFQRESEGTAPMQW